MTAIREKFVVADAGRRLFPGARVPPAGRRQRTWCFVLEARQACRICDPEDPLRRDPFSLSTHPATARCDRWLTLAKGTLRSARSCQRPIILVAIGTVRSARPLRKPGGSPSASAISCRSLTSIWSSRFRRNFARLPNGIHVRYTACYSPRPHAPCSSWALTRNTSAQSSASPWSCTPGPGSSDTIPTCTASSSVVDCPLMDCAGLI